MAISAACEYLGRLRSASRTSLAGQTTKKPCSRAPRCARLSSPKIVSCKRSIKLEATRSYLKKNRCSEPRRKNPGYSYLNTVPSEACLWPLQTGLACSGASVRPDTVAEYRIACKRFLDYCKNKNHLLDRRGDFDPGLCEYLHLFHLGILILRRALAAKTVAAVKFVGLELAPHLGSSSRALCGWVQRASSQ